MRKYFISGPEEKIREIIGDQVQHIKYKNGVFEGIELSDELLHKLDPHWGDLYWGYKEEPNDPVLVISADGDTPLVFPVNEILFKFLDTAWKYCEEIDAMPFVSSFTLNCPIHAELLLAVPRLVEDCFEGKSMIIVNYLPDDPRVVVSLRTTLIIDLRAQEAHWRAEDPEDDDHEVYSVCMPTKALSLMAEAIKKLLNQKTR